MSLPNLSPDQFSLFFEAVHGQAPFLWQIRMAAEVIASNEWPAVVSLPTATGKTSLIDIAIFALACEAHLHPAKRRAPLRIFFVIDRRVVADEAFGRAEKIKAALYRGSGSEDSDSILGIVAERLHYLAGKEGSPLECVLLRGGIALDDGWIRSPVQPTVCVSTVDQVGSRLLFRGYGVKPRQRSMHAAMIAHDSLIVLDEAHISHPFCQTLASVRRFDSLGEGAVIRPLRFVQMTATPSGGITGFTLRPEEAAEPELARRISSKKPTLLETVAEAADERNQSALIARAVSLAETWGKEKTRVIGIVVNRVLTARRIFDALDETIGEKALFIGRIRALDRDRLWDKWRDRLTSDPSKRKLAERTIFIVATQTIEVGADLDFDALISELAPLSSLRQRFGRLNRRGSLPAGKASIGGTKERPEVKAVVISTKEQIGSRYDDPVYGKTLAPTWKWLQGQLKGKGRDKTVDFAHTNLQRGLEETEQHIVESLSVLPPEVPRLLRSHLDAWACTAVPMMHDPDVAPFLHGKKPPELEVQIVWRADLDEPLFDLQRELLDNPVQRESALYDLIELLPPSSREALPLPLPTAIRWLQQLASLQLTDTVNSSDAEPDRGRLIRPVIIWRNTDDVRFSQTRAEIRPGDVLIVPASYGGIDEFGWIGTGRVSGRVIDLAEEAAWESERSPFIRLHPKILAQQHLGMPKGLQVAMDDEENKQDWKSWLVEIGASFLHTSEATDWRERESFFQSRELGNVEVIRKHYYSGVILRSRFNRDPLTTLWADDGRDEASETLRVDLADHLLNVAGIAKHFASDSGLSAPLIDTLQRSAELHDIGKADPRTQVIFFGSELSAYAAVKAGHFLAKSSHRFSTPAAYRQLLRLARLPSGARHETLSVFLAESDPVVLEITEHRDLALHLIGAHHGYARPLLRPLSTLDSVPDTVNLQPLGLNYVGPTSYESASFSSEVSERYLRLQELYGWWGLAWLETLLRLADWAQSAAEQKSISAVQ